MTLLQLLAYGFVVMTCLAGATLIHSYNLRRQINQMESDEYREQVCREVLIDNRKMKGF